MGKTEKTYPVVLRMAGLFPADLGGYESHRIRKGGDLGHVDMSRVRLNRRLHGSETWAREVQEEIGEMAAENFADELEKLKKRRRKSELRKRLAEGPRDPWRATLHGPLREIILTANREWFGAEDETASEATADGTVPIDALFGETREEQFEERALAWLKTHFGDDLVHARADLDEEAYHIHAVIMPRATTKDGRRMLQPSRHDMIRDYEAAQDSIGQWFADFGPVCGERRAKAIREAIAHIANLRPGETPRDIPEKRRHVSPRSWRRAQERKLAARDKETAQRKTRVAARQRDADEVLEIAEAVASGETDVGDAEHAESRQDAASPPRGKRATKARSLFGKALARLKRQAHEEARTELDGAFEQIRKADDAILRIMRQLPKAARETIAEARKGLAARITTLRYQIGKQGARDRSKKANKGPGSNRE